MLGVGLALGAFAVDVLAVMALVGPVPVTDLGKGLSVLLPLTVAAVVVGVATVPVTSDRAEKWLTARGLPPDKSLLRAAAAWLRRTRTARAVGFSSLLVSGTAPAWFINVSGLQQADPLRAELLRLVSTWPLDGWAAPVAGYALGALVADLTRLPMQEPTQLRVAAMQPRPVAAYLQPFSCWGPRLMAAAAVAIAVTTAVAGTVVEVGPTSFELAAWAVIGLGVNEAVLHGVVRRRQPAADAAAIAFDDAARATTVHAVAGSTIGILGAIVGDHLQWVAVTANGPMGQIVGLLAVVVAVGSFGVWLGHGVGLAHRVRRSGVTVDA